jgi:hypothetical protein
MLTIFGGTLDSNIRLWNRFLTGILASFPCKLNTFRNTVREAITSKEALSED